MPTSTKTPEQLKGTRVPSSAFTFADLQEGGSDVCFSARDGGGETADITAYSGGVIKSHWYWDDLAIDLSGGHYPGKKFPVLFDHDDSDRAGFSTKPVVEDGKLKAKGVVLLDNKNALQFISDSKKGFPFQASVRVRPNKVQRLAEGEEAEVNGFTLKGPGSIFREWTYREVSICTFGYDPNTKAVALSDSAEDTEVELILSGHDKPATGTEDTMPVTVEQFKNESPEAFKALQDELTASVLQSVETKLKEKDDQIVALTAQTASKEAEVKDAETRLSKMEGIVTKLTEKQLAVQALSVIKNGMQTEEALKLPARLQEKITGQFSKTYDSFIKDDVLDETALSAAVAAEVKDYASMFASVTVQTPIKGSGGVAFQRPLVDDGDEAFSMTPELEAELAADRAAMGIVDKKGD